MRFLAIFGIFALAISAGASEGLVSNYTFATAPGLRPNSVQILARGDLSNGVTVAQFASSGAEPQLQNMQNILFDDDLVAVHDNVFADLTGAGRRTPQVWWQENWVLPAVGLDSNKHFLRAQGLLLMGINAAQVRELWSSDREVLPDMISGMAVDAAQNLWVAHGANGVVQIKPEQVAGTLGPILSDDAETWLWYQNKTAFTAQKLSDKIDTTGLQAVLAWQIDTVNHTFWMGTPKGLWRGTSMSADWELVAEVAGEPVTGIWLQGAKILVETSRRDVEKMRTISQLWISADAGANFTPVNFQDRAAKLVRNAYDSLDVSISAVAFTENYVWAAVQGIENNVSGLLRIKDGVATRWDDEETEVPDNSEPWVWGLMAGVLDRDVLLTSVNALTLQGRPALVATTYGAGISVSLDEGATWRSILNLAPIKGNLAEVRLTPSVMRGRGATAEIGYRLDKNTKVTIEILSYDMRKVRTIVANQSRTADPIRSTVPREDFWDGRDDFGNFVALGIYYVRVKPQKGKPALGKVMWLGDRP